MHITNWLFDPLSFYFRMHSLILFFQELIDLGPVLSNFLCKEAQMCPLMTRYCIHLGKQLHVHPPLPQTTPCAFRHPSAVPLSASKLVQHCAVDPQPTGAPTFTSETKDYQCQLSDINTRRTRSLGAAQNALFESRTLYEDPKRPASFVIGRTYWHCIVFGPLGYCSHFRPRPNSRLVQWCLRDRPGPDGASCHLPTGASQMSDGQQ